MIIRNNDLIWLSNFIATAVTAIVAYFAHLKITWREREVTRADIVRFFVWNGIIAFLISPLITQLFSLITPLYESIYGVTLAMNLPISYEFVLTTGAFILNAIVILVLNFLFYDKFVFKVKNKGGDKKV